MFSDVEGCCGKDIDNHFQQSFRERLFGTTKSPFSIPFYPPFHLKNPQPLYGRNLFRILDSQRKILDGERQIEARLLHLSCRQCCFQLCLLGDWQMFQCEPQSFNKPDNIVFTENPLLVMQNPQGAMIIINHVDQQRIRLATINVHESNICHHAVTFPPMSLHLATIDLTENTPKIYGFLPKNITG